MDDTTSPLNRQQNEPLPVPIFQDVQASREAAVAKAAFALAEERGFAPGHELDDWLAAEAAMETIRLAFLQLELGRP